MQGPSAAGYMRYFLRKNRSSVAQYPRFDALSLKSSEKIMIENDFFFYGF